MSKRYQSTLLAAELAFGDLPTYDTLADSDAAIERAARRNRWLRRKASK
jgi:hypothetical protein